MLITIRSPTRPTAEGDDAVGRTHSRVNADLSIAPQKIPHESGLGNSAPGRPFLGGDDGSFTIALALGATMVETGRARYTPHALVATMVFEFMHVADELAGNWAPFDPINVPSVATVSMGLFTLVGAWGLWWVSTDRPWGYGLAAAFGLFFLIAETWHLVDPANMTPLRWAIVLLAQFFGAAVVVLGVTGLRAHEPWR